MKPTTGIGIAISNGNTLRTTGSLWKAAPTTADLLAHRLINLQAVRPEVYSAIEHLIGSYERLDGLKDALREEY